MSEVENIKMRYGKRRQLKNIPGDLLFNHLAKVEREYMYELIFRKHFEDLSRIKILEIGAGGGYNIPFFHRAGIALQNIFANELLKSRYEELKKHIPAENVFPGNAENLSFKNQFEIVMQSTVFTSILNDNFKRRIADKMLDMVKPGGIILWYDFIYDNPFNKDVKGVSKKEIKKLFSSASKIEFYPVTLAPPIGRRVGRLYNIFNLLFPFLRTHVIAVIHKC